MPGFHHSALFDAHGSDEAHDPAVAVSVRDLIEMAASAGILQPLRTVSARARRAGGHLSRARGRGMDYQESRAYQAGDDIRAMDWRITARAVEPHTKVFHEERERPVILAVDLGPGMFFATRGALKSVQAARTAAMFGWAAVSHGDRVGALLFNGDHRELQPRGGRAGILAVIRELVARSDARAALAAPAVSNGLNAALLRLRRLVRPGSLVILISDFYGLQEESLAHLSYLRRHSDLLAVRVLDPLERIAPPAGQYALSDGRERYHLDATSDKERALYQDLLLAQHVAVQDILQRCGVPLLELTTDENVGEAMALQLHSGTCARRQIA